MPPKCSTKLSDDEVGRDPDLEFGVNNLHEFVGRNEVSVAERQSTQELAPCPVESLITISDRQERMASFKSMAKFAGATGFVALALVSLMVTGCKQKRAQGDEHGAKQASVKPESTWRYVLTTEAGKQRVYITDTLGNGRLLIRSNTDGGGAVGAPAAKLSAETESEPTRMWLAGRARASAIPLPLRNDPATHDALLETAGRLEKLFQQDPTHLGILRDMIVAYMQLLEFESTTSLGANICLLGARRISEFEQKASPLGPDDQRLVEGARTEIFCYMKLFPCVVDYLRKSGHAEEANPWQQVLAILGQEKFTDLGTFSVGKLTVQTFRNDGLPPNPQLLWEELYFVISGRDPKAPESTTAYVLVQQGPPGKEAYYLYFRAVNRSQLVLIFGRKKPDYEELRNWIEGTIRAALSSANSN